MAVGIHSRYTSLFLPFQIHNKYKRAKLTLKDKEEADDFHKFVIKRLNDLAKEDMDQRSKFSWKYGNIRLIIILK